MSRLSRPLSSDAGAAARRRSRRVVSPLLAPLEALYRQADWETRAELDAIRYPIRYPDPADREVVALFSACMAYGRVELFGRAVEWALARMGESPARFVRRFDHAEHGPLFDGF